jgi:hypothetical protein
MQILPQDLTEGVKFKVFNSDIEWTVCVNPERPEKGQYTTWANKPAIFATAASTEGDALGLILLEEIEKLL